MPAKKHPAKKMAESVLHKQISVLEKQNKNLEQFVYSVSHDLKAPLRSIKGLVYIARAENTEPHQDDYLLKIERSINKLDLFINDLINFSRNSSLGIKVSRIYFKRLIKDIFENLKYIDNVDEIKTDFAVDDSQPFFSDSSRIEVILNNLISNAIKYQKISNNQNKFLGINILTSSQKCTIEISDNGIGIEKNNFKRIFKMFLRASELSQGSGLGLFIVKEVVKKLKGSIKINSRVGVGSTFTVTLPNLKLKAK